MTHPWHTDARRRDAVKVVDMLEAHGCLRIENARHVAATYGVPVAMIEAEMMRHLSENGEGK